MEKTILNQLLKEGVLQYVFWHWIHDGFNVTLALCDRSFKRLNTRLSNAIFQNVKHGARLD